MGLSVFNTEKVDTTKQPMFFGKPLGMQRYDEYKYPDFDKLTQTQLGYFWRPEEVSLQKDRADYQTLNAAPALAARIDCATENIRVTLTLIPSLAR